MTTGQTPIEVPDELWRSHAERLLGELTTGGHLSRRWAQVFRAVPRHLFVPRYWALDHHNHPDTLIDPATEPDHRTTWLTAVYRDQALITTWNPTMIGDRPIRLITSSASQPSVVATMLDRLDLQPGHRVLEIGTGTGYNTALVRHEAPLFPCGDERSPPLACRSRLMKLGAV